MNETARKLAQREPLVPLIDVDDFQGLNRQSADRVLARTGRVPNQARAMANAGDLGGAYRRLFEDISAYAAMPAGLRLLIRYKVSTLNTCLYCSAHQIKYMAQTGVAEEKIANIHDSDTHPAFDERERVALAFAKAMGEFGATITFVANIPGETQTLPTAIYAFLQLPGGDAAALRLVAISVALAMGALVVSEWLSRRVAARIAGK